MVKLSFVYVLSESKGKSSPRIIYFLTKEDAERWARSENERLQRLYNSCPDTSVYDVCGVEVQSIEAISEKQYLTITNREDHKDDYS